MSSTPQFTPAPFEAQLEEIRATLQAVHGTLNGTQPAATDLETLIRELLSQGITRHDIAFLIDEARP